MLLSDRVLQIIGDELYAPPAMVKPDSHLIEDLGMDSLEQVELVSRLEHEFDIEIEFDAAENFVHISDVIEYISKKKPDYNQLLVH